MRTTTEALQGKAVHFCRMLRLQPETDTAAGTESEATLRETLADIKPEEMLRRTFANLYKSDLPDALLERFRKAEAEARMRLCKALKQARTGKEMSQMELSENSGVARSSIARIEGGNLNASLNTILSLCEALDCSLVLIPR